jgi:molybdopterin-guanine dinucleotide biosynthesis protein MobB
MDVAAFIGASRSGKTTLIAELIRRYVGAGRRVSAIKHTHHPLNEENRGDTARFREAGAEPVILAGDDEAVIFAARGTSRIRFAAPAELLAQCDAEIVLIEGFKQIGDWPRIEVEADTRPTADEAASILDRIWRS